MEATDIQIPAYLDRSVPLLTPEGIGHLATRTVAVAGCGELSGPAPPKASDLVSGLIVEPFVA